MFKNGLPLMRRASYVLAMSCGLFSLAAPRFTHSGDYTRLAELPTAPALVPPPLGQVRPSGWLRDWAVAARNGINASAPCLLWTNGPADHTGWRLQGQTNILARGLSTNWFDVEASTASNQLTIPLVTASPAVFYRLAYP